MRWIVLLSLALIVGGGFIWLADAQPGFVYLRYGAWSLESSLVVAIVFFMVAWWLIYLLVRLLGALFHLPEQLGLWQQQVRHRRAAKALTQGLITLEEGRWAAAEKILIKHARHSDTPLLHYLAAARAAQKQDLPARRDEYLRLAHETTPGSDIAVGVVQAELQLDAGQREQALATLQHLLEMAPKHRYVLQLLNQLQVGMGNWHGVAQLLPKLKKHGGLSATERKSLAQAVMVGQFQQAYDYQDWGKMQQLWQQASPALKRDETLLALQVQALNQQGEAVEAARLMENYLRKHWSDRLVRQYAQLNLPDPLAQLATAEQWLERHTDNADLYLTLGRLSQRNQLWAKAEQYLRQSIALQAGGEAYEALAEVLCGQGQLQAGAQVAREGLRRMLAHTDHPRN